MFSKVTKLLPHYISLFALLGVAMVGILTFAYDKYFESAIIIATGAAFVVWGVVHHHLLEESHPKVFIEYLSIALLGVVVLLSLVWA